MIIYNKRSALALPFFNSESTDKHIAVKHTSQKKNTKPKLTKVNKKYLKLLGFTLKGNRET